MNIASIGRLKMSWYEVRKSATSNVKYSVRKSEGPLRRLERGSEWELIKILLEGD
jgi:hypothetical protein